MELLLLRHGPTEAKDDWRGDDQERPLSDEGRLLVADVGGSLMRYQTQPDLILTSPYTRARQTAQIMAECLSVPDAVMVDTRLAPGFGLKQLGKLLRDHADRRMIMLVGHEPDLSDVVRALTGGGRLTIRKAGVAQVEVADPRVLKGRLISLLVPTPVTP